MLRLKALLENKQNLAAEIRRQADLIQDGNGDHTPEQKAAWDKVNEDYNANEKLIGFERRASEVEASLTDRNEQQRDRRPAPQIAPQNAPSQVITDEQRAKAVAGWVRETIGGVDALDDEVEAMRLCNVRPGRELVLSLGGTQDFEATRQEYLATPPHARKNLYRGPGAASLLTTTTTAAGYLVAPGTLLKSLEINMLNYGSLRQNAQVIKTDNGEVMYWPTADDTSNTGEILTEVQDHGATVNPAIGRQSWGAFKFSSKLIRYSHMMLEDSAFDLVTLLGEMLGERLGRITNTKFTVGGGTTEPDGIVPGGASAFTAAATTAVTGDELIDLFHSVNLSYRANASFMFNDTVCASLRKLKDGDSNYLWKVGTGLADGWQDTLLGKPIVINSDMAAMTATLKPILFGDLSRYKIRSLKLIRLRRLVELYAQTDEEGLISFIREDGRLLNAGTNPVKYITMHA